MARQRNGLGAATAPDELKLASMTLAELHRQSAIALMDAALAHQGAGENTVSQNPLLINSFIKKPVDHNLVSISMRLGTKLAALGASAANPASAIMCSLTCRGYALAFAFTYFDLGLSIDAALTFALALALALPAFDKAPFGCRPVTLTSWLNLQLSPREQVPLSLHSKQGWSLLSFLPLPAPLSPFLPFPKAPTKG